MPFEFRQLAIPEVICIEAKKFGDERGFFMESYRFDEFVRHGIEAHFLQDNFSHSGQGVLRGLHYQINPYAQGKLVQAVRGEIFDVAVDIRQGSPTYSCWVGARLSRENGRLLWIPPGFAHGFCVMSKFADVAYKVTKNYSPTAEHGIIWNDPTIGIEWPIKKPSLSPRDLESPLLADAINNFTYDA